MHLTPQTTLSLLAVFWALVTEAGAAKLPKTIWGTQCWDVKTTRAKTEDCARALQYLENLLKYDSVWNGPHDGCTEITWSGDCGIELCNQRPVGTHISTGAILAAAQIQDSICRTDDGATGGITAIEGFEQFGEEHSYAEIHLATTKLTRHNNPDNNQPDKSKRYAKKNSVEKRRALARRDEEGVSRTQFVVREQWARWDSAIGADMTTRNQADITARIRTSWNSDNGHVTRRRSAMGTVSDSNGNRWTLTFHTAGLHNLNSIPILDRELIINAFFTLRNRIGRAHFGSPNIMAASVINDETRITIGHLTLMMIGEEVPGLNFPITMPNLRGTVIQFSGSII